MANSGGEYRVFLNFCGPDTHHGFTNSLYHALKDARIPVFMADKELPRGETFSSNLLQAIDDSKLYLTIFSPNYASHQSCLRELAKMVENISKPEEDWNKKVILPIFYDVKPDDVKLKTDLYSKAILELEQKIEDQKKKFRTEEVETWRRALEEVDAIEGLELEKYEGDGDLINSVVKEVVNKLQTRQISVPADLIGMEGPIAYINNLLDIKSGGVRLIGICGMCGIGKTTLAKIIFNQLCPLFGKNCSFLQDVQEIAKIKGLVSLQQQLLFDFSNSKVAREIDQIDEGINWIGETICNKKALIVLDDVDECNQIQNLIGMNSLHPGTRIIVTTGDKRVLNIREFKYPILPYEMESLSHQDAFQLFSRHAFDDNFPEGDYYTLSRGIVSTTGGLPLALRAIGSRLFHHRKEEKWKEFLQVLGKRPYPHVMAKLHISYATLEVDQKQIFLDIACFFIGHNKIGPISLWKDCGFRVEDAIQVLQNMSMIKVLDDNSFWMHDQFRYLGREIAEQEQTRLWDEQDITCERSTKIKGSVRALYLRAEVGNPITLTVEQIKQFPHLQLLWLSNVICRGDLTGCLSELKWISLHYSHTPKHYQGFEATNLPVENVVVMELFGHEFTVDKVRSLTRGAKKMEVLTVCCHSPIKIMSRI